MDKGGGKKGGKGFGMSPDDLRLWRAFTRDIDPLEDPDWEGLDRLLREKEENDAAAQEQSVAPRERAVYARPQKPAQAAPSGPLQLDARTEQRLRRGQIPIEGTLDLHGLTQERAHRALTDFVLDAHGRGKRCLLVITGKGKSAAGGEPFHIPEGVLKQKVPMWLFLPPLGDKVLKIFAAQPKHGGGGALYVYLKRNRA